MLNDELFSLIKSMETSEKRYFKRFAQFHIEKDRNRYLHLFDWMDAQETYDEKVIKEQFRKAGERSFSANLSFNKRYLYELLLKCLRNYHARRSARIRLHETMIDIAVLQEKGLLESAKILLGKARRLADQHNLNALELDLIAQERKIVRQFATRDAGVDLDKIADTSTGILDRLGRELAILGLYEKVFLQARNKNYPADQLQELNQKIWSTVGNQPEEPQFSFDGVAYFHLIKSLLHRLNRRPEDAIYHLRLLLEHFEKHPELLRETEFQERYLNTLNNYFNSCLALGQEDECEAVIEKMAGIKASNLKMKAAVFHNLHYCRMLFNAQKGQYSAIINSEAEMEKGLKTYGPNIPKNRQLVFRYNVAVAFYLEKQPVKALDRITAIVQDTRQEMRQDVQMLARIFHLALHFEMGNEVYVSNLLPAIRQLARKNRKPGSPEVRILNALQEAVKTGRREAFKTLQGELAQEKGWEEFKEWAQRV